MVYIDVKSLQHLHKDITLVCDKCIFIENTYTQFLKNNLLIRNVLCD